MKKMMYRTWFGMQGMKRFLKSREGQGMVEYGLIIALVAIVAIVVLMFLGHSITNIFNKAANTLNNAAG